MTRGRFWSFHGYGVTDANNPYQSKSESKQPISMLKHLFSLFSNDLKWKSFEISFILKREYESSLRNNTLARQTTWSLEQIREHFSVSSFYRECQGTGRAVEMPYFDLFPFPPLPFPAETIKFCDLFVVCDWQSTVRCLADRLTRRCSSSDRPRRREGPLFVPKTHRTDWKWRHFPLLCNVTGKSGYVFDVRPMFVFSEIT